MIPIAIACKNLNLARLVSKHNLFVCKSNVSFSFPLRFFSTGSDEGPSNAVYDLLVQKHQFPPQLATVISSELSRFRSPEKADSTLSFLKESGFSSSQLERILKYHPRTLTASGEDDIKLRIKIFQLLGLSSGDIAKIICSNVAILNSSVKNRINPSLSVLKDLVGSNHEVARLLRRSAWFITADLEKNLLPNVEFLKNYGFPMEDIFYFLYKFPRSLLTRPDNMRESVDKARELGLGESSKMFVNGVRVISSLRRELWEMKWQAFRDLGFSDISISNMFRKAPFVFCVSVEKVKKVKELLLATGKFSISSIADNPTSLTRSIEKRLEPRLRILKILESKKRVKKWPTLASICVVSDDKFCEMFVKPNSKALGKEYINKSYVKAKRENKL